MLTNLTPEYKFTDGPAFVVGDYPYTVEGDEILVHIPSLMPDIPYNKKEVTTYTQAASDTIFLNSNHPNFPGVVAETNCVTAKVKDEMVLRLANAKLYENTHTYYGIYGKPIPHVPRKIEVEATTEVSAKSDMGTFKDIHLY